MAQIHQEVSFPAEPSVVYRALTESEAFTKWSGAPATISSEAGGEFRCFGDMILGRQVELVEGKRIVQAWRVANWPEGVYSIIRFDLEANGEGTKLTFEQNGAPDEQLEHLNPGWHSKYWKPLAEFLSA